MQNVRSARAVWLIGALVVAVLTIFAGGYGYHRDELYFLAAGRHLAWGYADQGPLTPAIARVMSDISPTSLFVLRFPSALAAGGTVVLTGSLARELGGSRPAQLLAALFAAVASIVLVTGHLLSTSTFDLLAWTAATWLVVRAIRSGDERLWLAVGAVVGVGLLNKPLPAFLAAGLVAGVLIAGPRRLLLSRWVWAGGAVAIVLWAPWLIWQARHDWPQLDVSRSIARGDSTSSQPWWAVVPFQFLLVSPPLAPVWIAGLAGFFRDPRLRELRFVAWAWVVLALVFMATGGKPYYLAGLLPMLIAAGAIYTEQWLRRGNVRVRHGLFVVAVASSALVSAAIALPLLPADHADPVIAMNGDVGETIGWPQLTRTVAVVYDRLPDHSHTVLLARNYGEAGAIDRYGPALGLPHAYSGHNAYGYWGSPPASDGPVVAVGLSAHDLAQLTGCRLAARISNDQGVDNDENGAVVQVCARPRGTWAEAWPRLRHLG